MPSTSLEDLSRRRAGRTCWPVGQVDLRDVAGDDRLRAEAEAREEHLHLLGRRVLRLVEDDERVVQRAAAHERERRDLDDAALDQLLHFLEADDVVERVVERAEIRIDLLGDVAGEEAEALAGFDGGAAEDDALDRLVGQRAGGGGDGEERLAGAGGADAEGDVVVLDRLQVHLLGDVARRDDAADRGLHARRR